MKKAFIAFISLSLALSVQAEDKKKNNSNESQRLSALLIKPDTNKVESELRKSQHVPKGNFFISAGPLSSLVSNTNFSERMSVSARIGFSVQAGYAFAFAKSRLLVSASYSEGGVNVAVGDLTGDGVPDKETAKMQLLSIPLQYQFFIDKRNIFYAGLGTSLSLLLPAVQKVRGYNEGFEKLDAGLLISTGARITPRIHCTATYQFGLLDIDVSAANSAKTRMAFLLFSYNIGPIIKIKPKGGFQ